MVCSISTFTNNVDFGTIEFGWINEEHIVTDDSRVTIVKLNNDSNLVTIIQFQFLSEDDEGKYICYTIQNDSLLYESTYLQHFTSMLAYICICINFVNIFIVPTPFMQISTLYNNEIHGNGTLRNITIGDPLTLVCTVTAVRGITSSVDIIWTSGGVVVVRRVLNLTAAADVEHDHAIYTDLFEKSLSAIDNRRVYECTVMIDSHQPIYKSDEITLMFEGVAIIIIHA